MKTIKRTVVLPVEATTPVEEEADRNKVGQLFSQDLGESGTRQSVRGSEV
jgi:hypothetical protein